MKNYGWGSDNLRREITYAAVGNNKAVIEFANGSTGVVAYYANGSKSLSKEYFEAHHAGRSAVLKDFRELEIYGRRPEKDKSWSQNKGQAKMVADFIDSVCDDLSCICIALCGGVSVQNDRVFGVQKLTNGVVHFFGSRNAGVAQTKIENILSTDFSRTDFAVFKNFSYNRALVSKRKHFLIESHDYDHAFIEF